MAEELSKLPQFTLNLRFLAKTTFPTSLPAQWPHLLAVHCGITERHLSELLRGEPCSPLDLQKVAAAFSQESMVLGSSPLYDGETILRENLRHLLGSLPKGNKARLARSIGIRPEQLSRWGKDVTPELKNLRRALKFFQLDPDRDLKREPLFLSLDPVGAHAQKEWLTKRVADAHPSEIGKLFEAFKLLLPPNAPD